MKNIRKKTILITGGNGYIGSCLALVAIKKFNIIIIDKNAKNRFVKNKRILNFRFNINNASKLNKIVKKFTPDIIIHLAAQSTLDFINLKRHSYLDDNIKGTKNIIDVCIKNNIKKLIFSSTASVYKEKNKPLKETDSLKPNNLYGKTKLTNEKYIQKLLKYQETKYCILRFFNVCSALKKYNIGEFHSPETHLLPKVINAISNKQIIKIYGNNYKTYDGTCVRDFIHIEDVVSGILKSINYLEKNNSSIFNLGSSKETSVLEIINRCSKLIKNSPKINICKRRKGDVSKLNCKIQKAKNKLKWKPKNSNLSKIISDEIWWLNYLNRKKIKRNIFNNK